MEWPDDTTCPIVEGHYLCPTAQGLKDLVGSKLLSRRTCPIAQGLCLSCTRRVRVVPGKDFLPRGSSQRCIPGSPVLEVDGKLLSRRTCPITQGHCLCPITQGLKDFLRCIPWENILEAKETVPVALTQQSWRRNARRKPTMGLGCRRCPVPHDGSGSGPGRVRVRVGQGLSRPHRKGKNDVQSC